jgi:energy-coupling factor transport system ATP-binding protein
VAYIQIENLSFAYPAQIDGSGRVNTAGDISDLRLALDHISLNIKQGDFVLFCGSSGSGKSTLLRHLKPAIAPYGHRGGGILVDGKPLDSLSAREQAERIGFVSQSPDNQIVTDKVWHELAFGLESLGLSNAGIRLKVAEMASYFGIQEWFYKSTLELSGGQKQILNLAAVMVMQPDILVLDEPTSQLDPIAASEFLSTLAKINDDLGCTIIISEQRLEEVLPLASQVYVLESGRLLAGAAPADIGHALQALVSPMLAALPTPTRIALETDASQIAANLPLPVTVREGRSWLAARLATPTGGAAPAVAADAKAGGATPAVATDAAKAAVQVAAPVATTIAAKAATPATTTAAVTKAATPAVARSVAPDNRSQSDKKPALTLRDVWYRYSKNSRDVLAGLSLQLEQSELFCVVGGNGSGKSTALAVIAGLCKPYRGKIVRTDAKLAMLPQDPQTLFVRETLRADLNEVLQKSDSAALNEVLQKSGSATLQLCDRLGITSLLERHPYDISGGEQQRAALIKVLLTQPDILLLDEPTKGLDATLKLELGKLLHELCASGISIIMVSHDIEFCATYADRCAMLFNGELVASGTAREFFANNSFYTTAANRMARKWIPGAVLSTDVVNFLTSNHESCYNRNKV